MVIFLALMVFTITTVAVAFVNLGPFNIVVALAIASIKAVLVILFFMHMRYSPKRTQLVLVCGFFWLAIMLTLTLADYRTRQREGVWLRTPQQIAAPAFRA
jgi:cytochrome c oxidase subunit 4